MKNQQEKHPYINNEKLFKHNDGNSFKKKCEAEAWKIFDPIWVTKQSGNIVVNILIDQLQNFGFGFMNDSFIAKMKEEFNYLIHIAKTYNINLDTDIPESKQYNSWIKPRQLYERKNKIYNSNRDNKSDNQSDKIIGGELIYYNSRRDDPRECVRRIWYWWDKICKIEKRKLGIYWRVLCLIIINQLLSASIERVFFLLNFMYHTIGPHTLENTIGARLILQCN